MASGVKRQSAATTQSTSKKPRMSAKSNSKQTQLHPKEVDDPCASFNPFQAPSRLLGSSKDIDGDVIPDAAQWRSSFCEEVHEKEEDMLKRLKAVKGKIQADQQKFENSILAVLRQATLPIDAVKPDTTAPKDSSTLKVPVTAIGYQELGDHIADLITASNGLVKQYNTLTTIQPHHSKLDEIRSTFKKDKEAALATIAAGRKVATVDIQNMLADRYHEVRGKSEVTADENTTGRMLLAKGKVGGNSGGHEGVGWGAVALDMKKGIGKLGRCVSQ